jgi:hypothetical protein
MTSALDPDLSTRISGLECRCARQCGTTVITLLLGAVGGWMLFSRVPEPRTTFQLWQELRDLDELIGDLRRQLAAQ